MSCSDGIEPLLLPIVNVTVSPDGRTNAYGIEFIVGEPQQIVALTPVLSDQDIFVKNANDCNGTSDNQCIGNNGGVYDPALSDTFSRSTLARWNGTETFEEIGAFTYFNDIIRYGEEGESHGFPLYTNEPGVIYSGGLGLGRNSTFLDAAVETQQAPSRSVGLWPGSLSQTNPQNGLVVIGGHDSSRVDGNFTSLPYQEDCPTCVIVESMTFDRDGDSTSLLDGTEDRRVMLNPYWRDLLIQNTMFDLFRNITGAEYTFGLGLYWRTEEAPIGNISITLEGGYQTVIPPEHFFQYARSYMPNGSFEILGDELLIARLNNYTGNFVPHWGIPFLSMNYLLLDHDNQELKIAPAVQDLPYGAEPVIEPICSAESSSSTGGAGGTNAGAIAGGVVGGLAGLALIVFGLWWFWWRNKKAAIAANAAGASSESSVEDQSKAFARKDTVELSSAGEKGELAGTPISPATELATPEQTKFDYGKANAKEMASPEQMDGSIHKQLAKQSPNTPTTASELMGTIPEKAEWPQLVEMPADEVKSKE